MRITADSRYTLYVNSEFVGQGPVREWPSHWRYDEYDLQPYLRRGENVIAVLVNHWGDGNFQYVHVFPACWPNWTWMAMRFPPIRCGGRLSTRRTSRSLCGLAASKGSKNFFDGRLDDGWTRLDYDDASWPRAAVLRPALDGAHGGLEPRGIPFLTADPILPERVISVESVRSVPYVFSVFSRPVLDPGDLYSNLMVCHAYLATQVWSESETDITSVWAFNVGKPRLNGIDVEGDTLHLNRGWNSLVFKIDNGHPPDHVFCFDGPRGIIFSCTGEENAPPWAIVGPFGLGEEGLRQVAGHMDESLVVVNPAEPDYRAGADFWRNCSVASVVNEPYFRPLEGDNAPAVNVFARAYTDKVVSSPLRVDGVEDLVSKTG